MTNAGSGRDRAALMNDSAALAERLGVGCYHLRVIDVIDFGRAMRRIVLTAPELAELAPRPGQDLMLSIASSGPNQVRRRYTIRHHDPAASTVAIDMVLHGDGPGARWAATAQAGDAVEAIGPRGAVTVDDTAAWHLFVGDKSFFPAMSAMIESLPATVPTVAICEADVPGELPPMLVTPTSLQLLTRTGAARDARQVLAALEATARPPGRGRAYLGGEFHVVHALKAALLASGLDDEQIAAKPYWRAGSANANHGEPDRAPA